MSGHMCRFFTFLIEIRVPLCGLCKECVFFSVCASFTEKNVGCVPPVNDSLVTKQSIWKENKEKRKKTQRNDWSALSVLYQWFSCKEKDLVAVQKNVCVIFVRHNVQGLHKLMLIQLWHRRNVHFVSGLDDLFSWDLIFPLTFLYIATVCMYNYAPARIKIKFTALGYLFQNYNIWSPSAMAWTPLRSQSLCFWGACHLARDQGFVNHCREVHRHPARI